MAVLLTDEGGKPIPQYQNAAGTAFEAVKGADGHMSARSDDGKIVTLGTTTDEDTANTVIGRLKKLISLIPAALTAGGNLKTAVLEALPAGTSIIGKFGIDQTTPGTTNGIQVVAALPAGTNNIGDVDIVSKPGYSFLNVTTDTQIKGSAGKLRKVIVGKVTVAGDLVLYDSLTETGTVVATLGLETTGNPKELEFDATFTTGLYAGFDASLAGNITFVYE